MKGDSRKWVVLAAVIWIQAFTGTNLDFASYSTRLKSVLGVSQVQLNYISVASDAGKAFGWCSGICLLYFSESAVMFFAAIMGLIGYGLQWLVIQQIISMPYYLVLISSLLAGSSVSWFNTVCYVVCIKTFRTNRALALALTISFNGLSAAIYNLTANSIDPNNDTKLYLLLNATIPLITSVLALRPIMRSSEPQSAGPTHRDRSNFIILTALAVITGLYLLALNSMSWNSFATRVILSGAVILLLLPLATPRIINSYIGSSTENDDLEIQKELIGTEALLNSSLNENASQKDRLVVVLGDEHSTAMLIRNREFWLYYVVYLCGGTLGLVYSNNLGQISQSLGFHSDVRSLVSLYSACSFFGRLLSTVPELVQSKMYYPRTGWLTSALIPSPLAFLVLVSSNSKLALFTATALIGLSSGFVFSASVSITSELFGPKQAGVNHNILITNIPLGSLLYSLLAAQTYEANIGINSAEDVLSDCMGKDCYYETFIFWWWISMVGLACSSLLYRRTKGAYERLEKEKHVTRITLLRPFSLPCDGN
ncbi:Major facilitator superfamily protein [Striga hermonthica]|uniref:Major facilitator superfamily protein n=1 Tax=Striga hermonthica TaxID=68872 RepID=A0A9N7N248_STRHE|nr:Major facilitator superfamily protein [Striga hermonthica]